MTILEQRAYEAIASLKKDEPDYWEKLKHQAAISAMQGLLSNTLLFKDIDNVTKGKPEDLTTAIAIRLSTALVDKLKEK